MPAFIKKFIIIASLAYLGLFIFGAAYSDDLIFMPQAATYSWSDDLISIQSKKASAPDEHNTIVAHYLKNPESNYTILYSHGNAVDLGGLEHLKKNFYQHGFSIFIYDYSGYGLSEGVASEQQVYNDVAAAYAYLIKKEKLNPSQIISYGHSLGTAIATDLAYKNPVAALILESPFTTAFRVKTVYPLLPFDKFSSIDKIDKVKTPVFITHSRDDAIVAFWHSEELFNKAASPKKSLWLDHQGHSSITHSRFFWMNLNTFITDYVKPKISSVYNFYLPIQKSEKILPSKSSLLNSPVMDDNASCARRNSSANSSPAFS